MTATASLLSIVLMVLLAFSLERAEAIGDPARARSCGWILEPSADRENVLFPDTAVRYLAGSVPVPPGGHVEITGEFPHARYMSLQGYTSTLQTTTNLRDDEIRPDPGSSNPFLPGAERNAAERHYTVKVVAGAPPAGGGAPNTLYTTSPDGTKRGNGLAYRIYLPDRSAGPFGGVPAPTLALVLAGGARIELPECPDLIPDVGLTQTLAGLGLADYLLPPLGALARPETVWHKYINAPEALVNGQLDSDHIPQALRDLITQLTAFLPSGLGENFDNKYVYTHVSQEFGRVVEFSGRLPTTPKTLAGEGAMGSGQLRYWSMCTGQATITYGCASDEDVPVDENGDFHIVMSTAAARPANAVTACGVAWLPWGPHPKGIAMMRNMLPAADFTQSVQAATHGTEEQTMGEYYPSGRYYSTPQDFEREAGCNPPAAVGGAAPAAVASQGPAAKPKKRKKRKKGKKAKRRRAKAKRHHHR